MRHAKLVIPGVLLMMTLGFAGLAAQTGGTEDFRVKELGVRVFLKGEPVPDLKKEDFQLYEDKTLQPIESVITLKRKIGVPGEPASSSRCFVLLFDITAYTANMQKGLEYMFNYLLGANDQLLLVANEQTLFFRNLSNKEKARFDADQFLVEQVKQTRQQMMADLAAIENLINLIRTRASRETDRHGRGVAVHIHYYMKYIKFSLEQYISSLQAYKKRYLAPDINNYYHLLKPIAALNREKWVIRFWQMPEIPELSGKNRAMIKKLVSDLQERDWKDENYYSELFTKMLSQMDNLFNAAADFPVEATTQLFYQADAAFHSIILPGSTEETSKNQKYQRLLADIERCLAEIARQTGGVGTVARGSMENALDTIRDAEDLCYTLVYTPTNPGKPRVEVINKDYRVFYKDAAGTAGFSQYLEEKPDPQTPSVQLKDVTFKNKTLSITINNYMRQETGESDLGRIILRIYINDNRNRQLLFLQSKTLLPQKDSLHVSLNFQWLPQGTYQIGIDARDLLTGKRAENIMPGEVQ